MRWRFGHGLFLFNFVVNAINDLWWLATIFSGYVILKTARINETRKYFKRN